jgi:hypothetical protein
MRLSSKSKSWPKGFRSNATNNALEKLTKRFAKLNQALKITTPGATIRWPSRFRFRPLMTLGSITLLLWRLTNTPSLWSPTMKTKRECAQGLNHLTEIRAMSIKTPFVRAWKVTFPRVPGLMISCLVELGQVGHLINVEEQGEFHLQTKRLLFGR